MHNISLFSDILGQPGKRKRLLQRSMEEIGRAGSGVIVLLRSSAPDAPLSSMIQEQSEDMDLRAYGIGAQILADLGVHDMVLLTNTQHTLVALEGYGLSIVGERPVPEGH